MQHVSTTIHWFLLKLSIAFDIFLHLGQKWVKGKNGNYYFQGAGIAFDLAAFWLSEKLFLKSREKPSRRNTSINSILRYHVGSFSLFTQICLFQLSRQKAENINRYEEIWEALYIDAHHNAYAISLYLLIKREYFLFTFSSSSGTNENPTLQLCSYDDNT